MKSTSNLFQRDVEALDQQQDERQMFDPKVVGRAVFLGAYTVLLAAVDAAPSPLKVNVSGFIIPGNVAQIRLTLDAPQRISSGSFSVDLDAAVYHQLALVHVLSATGDQLGGSSSVGNHLSIGFQSASGGIGQIPDLPMLVVTVPVVANAVNDARTLPRFTVGTSPWQDVFGNEYTPTFVSSSFQFDGKLWIGTVTPGGGILPAGAKVRITGSGFTAASRVAVGGAAVAATFLDDQDLDVTLGFQTDLTGKRVLVNNNDGSSADFYPALRGSPPAASLGENQWIQPIFPQQTFTSASLGTTQGMYALQNPGQQNANVVLRYMPSGLHSPYTGSLTSTLGPGETSIFVPYPVSGYSYVDASSDIPVTMMTLSPLSIAAVRGMTGLSVNWDGPNPPCDVRSPGPSRCWSAVSGAAPLQTGLSVQWNRPVPFTVAAKTLRGIELHENLVLGRDAHVHTLRRQIGP